VFKSRLQVTENLLGQDVPMVNYTMFIMVHRAKLLGSGDILKSLEDNNLIC